MTAAYRLKGLGWFGGCVVVTLAFYLVSLQVASERKRLEQVDGRIRVAVRDIRALETEFDTRANLAQLERWNGDTLALVAPGASQFVRDEAQLASIRFDIAPAAPGVAGVRTAALVVPSFTPQVSAPIIQPGATVSGAVTIKVAGKVAAKVAPATSQRASVTRQVAAMSFGRTPITKAVLTVSGSGKAPVRKQTVAMLLSNGTLDDLVSGARGEARTLR